MEETQLKTHFQLSNRIISIEMQFIFTLVIKNQPWFGSEITCVNGISALCVLTRAFQPFSVHSTLQGFKKNLVEPLLGYR
jgi:hypothetical protein